VSQYCDGFFRDELLRRNDLADPTPWVSVWDVSNVVSFETAFLSSGSRLVQAAWRAAR
jgi:hypothetical protein